MNLFPSRQKFPRVCYLCGVMLDLVPTSEELVNQSTQYAQNARLEAERKRGCRTAGGKRP